MTESFTWLISSESSDIPRRSLRIDAAAGGGHTIALLDISSRLFRRRRPSYLPYEPVTRQAHHTNNSSIYKFSMDVGVQSDPRHWRCMPSGTQRSQLPVAGAADRQQWRKALSRAPTFRQQTLLRRRRRLLLMESIVKHLPAHSDACAATRHKHSLQSCSW